MDEFTKDELELSRQLNTALVKRDADEAIKQLIERMTARNMKASAELVTFIPMRYRGEG